MRLTSPRASSRALAGGDVAAVLVQSPNFFGNLEDLDDDRPARARRGRAVRRRDQPDPARHHGAAERLRRRHRGRRGPAARQRRCRYGGPGLGFFACAEKLRAPDARPCGRPHRRRRRQRWRSCSRSRRASSTSAARRRRATSAATTRSTRSPRACTSRRSAQQGLPASRARASPRRTTCATRCSPPGKFTRAVGRAFGYEFTLALRRRRRRDAGGDARRAASSPA